MVALYVHNLGLNFGFAGPSFADPSILNVGCGLFRLTPAQLNAPMQLAFQVNDPFGFVDHYQLAMGRCPAPTLALQVNQPASLPDTVAGATVLASGNASGNTHNLCPGYTGTIADFATSGLVNTEIQPALSEGGWIRSGEAFTVLGFTLTARMRVTNGYNTGLSSEYRADGSIYLEPLP
jgi:hypothetical protein